VKVVLAGPDERTLTRLVYPAFAAAGLDVAAVVGTAEELAEVAGALGAEGLAVVEATLYPTPAEAAEGLDSLSPTRAAVVLPPQWEGESFAALPNLVGGFTAPVSWPQVVARLKHLGRGAAKGTTVEGFAEPASAGGRGEGPVGRLRTNTPMPGREGRMVAFWSGPAGGTGRTTLALSLTILAARRGRDVALLALSEPAVSAYLRLPRLPNVNTFFADPANPLKALDAATRPVGWKGARGARFTFSVILGPARPQDGVADREQVAGLIATARAAHDLVIVDLPALTPGGSVWALEPLIHAGHTVLVMPPTTAGVAAAVESLATLRDVGMPGPAHLALVRRAPGGLAVQRFVEAVSGLWGSCPEVAAEVEYLPALSGMMEREELVAAVLEPGKEMQPLAGAVEALGTAVAGLAAGIVEERPDERQKAKSPSGRRQRLGRLITVEVTD